MMEADEAKRFPAVEEADRRRGTVRLKVSAAMGR
jgi:hypothetical protein